MSRDVDTFMGSLTAHLGFAPVTYIASTPDMPLSYSLAVWQNAYFFPVLLTGNLTEHVIRRPHVHWQFDTIYRRWNTIRN